ncbi:MAG TPA: hypothetical protein VGN04_06185 [Herbaspirillum sp.]|jgi:hypothetical protein
MATFTQEIKAKEAELSERLETMRAKALARFAAIRERPSSVHELHASIGAKNNIFVDSVRMQFYSPSDFYARWVNGLTQVIFEKRDEIARRRRFGDRKRTEEVLYEMLQDPFLHEYVYLFLERNFYRNFEARMRAKPDELLWQLWFGSGNLVWGLLISPARRFGEWTNDKSQMRRESYGYWTIGHVLETGLVAPDTEKPIVFKDIDTFLSFYETVLARVSNSVYEKEISNRYIEYVRTRSIPRDALLLIPELRYAGKEAKHLYRLDFCVLNSYTMQMTGFEISPASSHMSIAGKAEKTQQTLNAELAVKWGKEANKRNAYFDKYGLTIVTFTDAELTNLERCWQHILAALEMRATAPVTVSAAEEALKAVYAAL